MLTLDILPSNLAVECAMDHKITRFIQQRLEKEIDAKEVDRFFGNLLCRHSRDAVAQQADFTRLITDMYANYVLQKMLAKLDQEQLDVVFFCTMNDLAEYIAHKHACRVVQVALEVFIPP